MLIPSIDLQDGHVVQLVQGERLAIEAPDPEPWIAKFSRFSRVQLIDLDTARGRGDNRGLVQSICGDNFGPPIDIVVKRVVRGPD